MAVTNIIFPSGLPDSRANSSPLSSFAANRLCGDHSDSFNPKRWITGAMLNAIFHSPFIFFGA